MENRQGATVQRPLQAVIRSECALYLYERRFPVKSDTPVQLICELNGPARNTIRRSTNDDDCTQFDWTTATPKWPVSAPLGAAPGVKRGSQLGGAHASVASLRCSDACRGLNTGRTERRPRLGYD